MQNSIYFYLTLLYYKVKNYNVPVKITVYKDKTYIYGEYTPIVYVTGTTVY